MPVDGSSRQSGAAANACHAKRGSVGEGRVQIPGRALPEIGVNSADGSVGLLGHIRIDQRHGATLCPHQLAGNPASPFQQILEPHQIVQHGDDAASGQAVVDAALKIVGTIVPQNGGQTLLPSNLAFMALVDAKSPYKTMQELTEAMKKKGTKATYATAANPGTIMGALYKQATGIEAVEVSYRNAPDSLNEMQDGKLDFAFHDPIFALAQVREGRMRVLAVSSSDRLSSLPDVPTMKETGIPMDLNIWWGVMVQKETPKPILEKINAMFRDILTTDDTKKFLALSGADPMLRTPEQADAMFQAAIKEWGDYVKLAKIPQN